MDVKLPNGVVISGIPEGTNKWSIVEKAINRGLATPEDFGQESAHPGKYADPIREAVGLGETVLQMGTGAIAQIPAGFAGIAASALPGGKSGAEAVNSVMDSMTYQPRTDVGKRTSEGVAGLLEPIERAADYAGEKSGAPTDTLGATAVKTALLAAPMALGMRGSRTPSVRPKVPTTAELRARAGQAYKSADESGVILDRGSFSRVVEEIRNDMAEQGIDADLHPRATAAMKRLMESAESGNNLSLKGAEILRRVVQGAEDSLSASERRIAGRMRRKLDNYVENLSGVDVIAGDAAAATALSEARDLWSKSRKSESIERLIERARNRSGQFTGSGFENALRNEFRALAQNDKKMRGYSAEEQAAIQKVARGGIIENSLRALGRFAPRGPVSTSLGAGAGFAVGGPVGSAALLTAGEIGRQGATMMTLRNAKLAAELMRNGSKATPKDLEIAKQLNR